MHPALACIELSSIARGIKMCDEMAKRAAVRVLQAITVCPGKFVVIIGGEVEEVQQSYARGLEIGGPAVVDQLILPNAHPQLIPAIEATAVIDEVKAVGVVETFAVASAIIAADAACKRAAIRLIEVRLARGIGGKAFFTLTGDQADVEAAVEAAEAILGEESGLLLRTEVIPRPHPDMVRWLL
ncbi:MAG: BMC domain-containing protein [Deltaproteobacteria bacterium]|nr:BMC domain-containing protein [Deltaproteobacteria bacterium]